MNFNKILSYEDFKRSSLTLSKDQVNFISNEIDERNNNGRSLYSLEDYQLECSDLAQNEYKKRFFDNCKGKLRKVSSTIDSCDVLYTLQQFFQLNRVPYGVVHEREFDLALDDCAILTFNSDYIKINYKLDVGQQEESISLLIIKKPLKVLEKYWWFTQDFIIDIVKESFSMFVKNCNILEASDDLLREGAMVRVSEYTFSTFQSNLGRNLIASLNLEIEKEDEIFIDTKFYIIREIV